MESLLASYLCQSFSIQDVDEFFAWRKAWFRDLLFHRVRINSDWTGWRLTCTLDRFRLGFRTFLELIWIYYGPSAPLILMNSVLLKVFKTFAVYLQFLGLWNSTWSALCLIAEAWRQEIDYFSMRVEGDTFTNPSNSWFNWLLKLGQCLMPIIKGFSEIGASSVSGWSLVYLLFIHAWPLSPLFSCRFVRNAKLYLYSLFGLPFIRMCFKARFLRAPLWSLYYDFFLRRWNQGPDFEIILWCHEWYSWLYLNLHIHAWMIIKVFWHYFSFPSSLLTF